MIWFFRIFFLGLLNWLFYHLRMGKKKEKAPEVLQVSDQELVQIKKNVESSDLGEREKKVVISILETYYYLVALYRAKRLSVQKLARMFGFKSEKQEHKTVTRVTRRIPLISPILLQETRRKRARGTDEGAKIAFLVPRKSHTS